jgi:hypothetical protein
MNETGSKLRRIVQILVILMVLTGAGYGYLKAQSWMAARTERAFYSEVDGLFEAFHKYKEHVGDYPRGNNSELAKALTGNNAKKVIILAVRKDNLNAKGEIVDPWGTPLKIYFADNEVLIRSAGPNRRFEDKQSKISDDYFRSD